MATLDDYKIYFEQYLPKVQYCLGLIKQYCGPTETEKFKLQTDGIYKNLKMVIRRIELVQKEIIKNPNGEMEYLTPRAYRDCQDLDTLINKLEPEDKSL